MGAKQAKPMIDVHAVQQKLPRAELLYLKNLFLFLVQSSAASAAAAASAANLSSLPAGSPHLNQSLSSSALANPSNMELMALRLPKQAAIAYLIAPSFPGLSSGLADRFFQLFDYNAFGSGLDYSEYLVMMWTLWYGSVHEELSKFLFALFDVTGSGKVGKKEYRKVAQALLEEYVQPKKEGNGTIPSSERSANGAANVAHAVASSNASESREYLSSLFDFYFHLALYQHDRDHDKQLSAAEFAHFAEEDLLLQALMHGRKDPRQAKQRVRELLGARGETLIPTPIASFAPPPGAKKLGSIPSNSNAGPSNPPPPGLLSSTWSRTFIGEEDVEDPSGTIWRQQRRSAIKQQVRRSSLAPAPMPNAPGTKDRSSGPAHQMMAN